MKRSQWFIFSIVFWILMILFITIDNTFDCDMFEKYELPLGKFDIWCIVNSEIYDPFIWIFATLGVACIICGCLEKKT